MSGLESEAPMIADTNPLPNADTWNKAETLDRLGGDEQLLEELIHIFASESPKLLDKLRQAVSTADVDAVMRGAHSIKGELSCLGAVAAAAAAQKLETMGSAKELTGAQETFTCLERELQSLRLLMADSIASHK
jgi:two-component system sensor histidine kinase/response regulator